MREKTIVRENLMTEKGYTPYCGAYCCTNGMPRTQFNLQKSQFTCTCGWISDYPSDFILRYKKKLRLK